MKYLTKCPKVVTWLTVALLTVTLLPSCSKPSTSRFLFHSPKEAIEACHSELTSLREIRTADIDKLTSVVNDWLILQDSVYNCLASDTTIQLNTNLTTYYYIIVDSIRDEIGRIARLQPRSLKDMTYLKIHTAKNREKTHSSKDFKNASELFGNMEGAGLYKDLNTTTEAYISLLETTDPFSKETDYINFVGNFEPMTLTANVSQLYLGPGNTLYYPNGEVAVNAFRGYFVLQKGLTAGSTAYPIRAINLDFGEETESTSISTINADAPAASGWYTLDGRRLLDEPEQPGMYIRNGQKVMIK